MERLARAAELAGADALLSKQDVQRLVTWQQTLAVSPGLVLASPNVGTGERLIFAPNSTVGHRLRGELIERKLLEPQLMSHGDEDILMYRYAVEGGGQGWVAHTQVQPTGSDWRYAAWNPSTNGIRELAV